MLNYQISVSKIPFNLSSVFMCPKQGGEKTDDINIQNEGKKYGQQISSSLCSWNISLSEHSSLI